jgi:lysophospholipase L1-like esterase
MDHETSRIRIPTSVPTSMPTRSEVRDVVRSAASATRGAASATRSAAIATRSAANATRSAASAGDGRRVPRVVVAATAGLALAAGPALALRRVRRMRREARSRPPLVLDLDLDGVEPRRTVVVLGDSSSAGFRLTSAEQSAARRVARALHLRDGRATSLRCAARNGATTGDVLADQVEAVAGADVVLIGVGANDAKDRVPTADVERALGELIVRVRELAAPEASIVLVGCPDLSAAPGLPRLVRLALRGPVRRVARLQQRVAEELGVPLVAIPRSDLAPAVFADDGFHPGPLGHERVSGRVLAHL